MQIRMLLILACGLSGFWIAYHYSAAPKDYLNIYPMGGLILGLLTAWFVIYSEKAIRKFPLKTIFGGVAGLFIGLLFAFLLAFGMHFVSDIMEKQQVVPWIYTLLTGIMGYLGLVIGSKKVDEFHFMKSGNVKVSQNLKIVDTSAIIDGRIADICDTGFVEGTLLIPKFVLEELQYVADSPDSLKRSRGRRGLDILNRMRKDKFVNIEIIDQDYPDAKGVDAKLLELAKQIHAKILTNDFNLNKVAELHGIKILNINELANALKPVILPGEIMTVKIVKEGKELGQGVAYMDDGMMIIVDNAQKYVGMNVEITVTSILQTTAGRMVFSEMKGLASDKKGSHAITK
ncbi:MAG: PIN domain-containing protein [Syntrophales bacterium]|nr:TRAM domain-containing protein [Syntrophales bacterium]